MTSAEPPPNTVDWAALQSAERELMAHRESGTLDRATFTRLWDAATAAVHGAHGQLSTIAMLAPDPAWLPKAWR